MNASEIILEAKSSRFDLYNRVSCYMIRLDLKPILSNKKSKKSYVENALIFMPSLLPICLGLTIWVSPEIFGLVGSRTIWSLLNRLFSEWFIESNKPCSDQAISHSTSANMFWLSKKNMYNKGTFWSPCPDQDIITWHPFIAKRFLNKNLKFILWRFLIFFWMFYLSSRFSGVQSFKTGWTFFLQIFVWPNEWYKLWEGKMLLKWD